VLHPRPRCGGCALPAHGPDTLVSPAPRLRPQAGRLPCGRPAGMHAWLDLRAWAPLAALRLSLPCLSPQPHLLALRPASSDWELCFGSPKLPAAWQQASTRWRIFMTLPCCAPAVPLLCRSTVPAHRPAPRRLEACSVWPVVATPTSLPHPHPQKPRWVPGACSSQDGGRRLGGGVAVNLHRLSAGIVLPILKFWR
jgi:hypothetical protein